MSWLGLDQLFNLELNKISASISVAIFTILYFIYKRYRQLNRYQNIDENGKYECQSPPNINDFYFSFVSIKN